MSAKGYLTQFWPAVLAFLSIGAATGFVVGLSQSPVVGVVLPLLFGLIAGGSGLWILKSNLNYRSEVHKLQLAGLGVLLFSVAFLASLWLGIYVRTDSPVASFRFTATGSSTEATHLDLAALDLPFDDIASVVAIRARLSQFGASKTEQSEILRYYLSSVSMARRMGEENSKAFRYDCNKMRELVSNLAEALSNTPVVVNVAPDAVENLRSLRLELTSIGSLVEACVSLNSSGDPSGILRANELAIVVANELRESLNRAIFERATTGATDSAWTALAAFPGASTQVANLYSEVYPYNPANAAQETFPKLPSNWIFSGVSDEAQMEFTPLYNHDGRYLAQVFPDHTDWGLGAVVN